MILHNCNHPGCKSQIAHYAVNICGYDSDHGCSELFCSAHMTLVNVDNKLILLCRKCKEVLESDDTFINGLVESDKDRDYQRMELNVATRLVLKLKQGLDADQPGLSRVLTSTQSFSPSLSHIFDANPKATCFLSCLDLINSMFLYHSIVAIDKEGEIIEIDVVVK